MASLQLTMELCGFPVRSLARLNASSGPDQTTTLRIWAGSGGIGKATRVSGIRPVYTECLRVCKYYEIPARRRRPQRVPEGYEISPLSQCMTLGPDKQAQTPGETACTLIVSYVVLADIPPGYNVFSSCPLENKLTRPCPRRDPPIVPLEMANV